MLIQRPISRIIELKNSGKKVILYAPTFRNARHHSITKNQVNFAQLDAFAAKYDIYIVF